MHFREISILEARKYIQLNNMSKMIDDKLSSIQNKLETTESKEQRTNFSDNPSANEK